MPVRVYYEDTDAGGVVYYTNYLKYAERARTEMLRAIGFENKAMKDDLGILFVVRGVKADYFKPAVLDDLLEVRTQIGELKNTNVVMRQSIYRDETLLFHADVRLVCITEEKMKPTRFPNELNEGFKRYLENGSTS